MARFRIGFMGTPPFAAEALAALIAAGHEIPVVYTQPPRPSGRGHKTTQSAVHDLAERQGIEVRCPASLRSVEERARFAALRLDLAVVAAYGLILPPEFLHGTRLGCFNIHASLLPRWRGAAPIQRAILAGDAVTGVTIMRMDKGLDTGPTLMRQTVPIAGTTTGAALTGTLARLGADLMVETLDLLAQDALEEIPQPERGVTYAAKLDRSEGQIDWTNSAIALDRKVRALNPWPGTFFALRGERIKLLDAEIRDAEGEPGAVLPPEDGCPVVACGLGALKLKTLQRPGKTAQDGASFLRGFDLPPGTILDHDQYALETHHRV